MVKQAKINNCFCTSEVIVFFIIFFISYRHGVSQTPRVYGGSPEIPAVGRQAVPHVLHPPPGGQERTGQRGSNDRWLQTLQGKHVGEQTLNIQLFI